MTLDLDAFKTYEIAGWERQAATYDLLAATVTARFVEPLLDAAHVGAGDRVLDLGTGLGEMAGAAAARGADVTGVDVAEAMLERARARHPSIDFRTGDAEALLFEDGSFDVAVGGFLLLHIGQPERAAAELARVLQPRGRVALTVWDHPSVNRYSGVAFEAMARVGAEAPSTIPDGPPVFRFADDVEFERLLTRAGFENVAVQTVAFTERVESADMLWDGLMGGTVRLAPFVLGQPQDVQLQIRAAFDELVAPYRSHGGYDLPVSAKLASGRAAQ